MCTVCVDVFPHWVHWKQHTHKKKRNAEKLVHVHMGQDKWILAEPLQQHTSSSSFAYSALTLHYIEYYLLLCENFLATREACGKIAWMCVWYVNVQILQLKIESSLLINHIEYSFFVLPLASFRIEWVFTRTFYSFFSRFKWILYLAEIYQLSFRYVYDDSWFLLFLMIFLCKKPFFTIKHENQLMLTTVGYCFSVWLVCNL